MIEKENIVAWTRSNSSPRKCGPQGEVLSNSPLTPAQSPIELEIQILMKQVSEQENAVCNLSDKMASCVRDSPEKPYDVPMEQSSTQSSVGKRLREVSCRIVRLTTRITDAFENLEL